MILLDTNLLGRLTNAADPQHAIARNAVQKLFSKGDQPVIVPQNLFEFWAVATRQRGPRPTGENGLGMSTTQAAQWVRFFRRRFTLLPDRADLVDHWQQLVERHSITGFKSHDVRLVAAMQSYGIERLMTFNVADFRSLPVVVVEPTTI